MLLQRWCCFNEEYFLVSLSYYPKEKECESCIQYITNDYRHCDYTARLGYETCSYWSGTKNVALGQSVSTPISLTLMGNILQSVEILHYLGCTSQFLAEEVNTNTGKTGDMFSKLLERAWSSRTTNTKNNGSDLSHLFVTVLFRESKTWT